MQTLFEERPIPVGAIDEANGREIIGWEIVCDDDVIIGVGNTEGAPGDGRRVPRVFGAIVLRYAPVS